jgi:pimeloyl-ACP methyl ester carboxylesterase
MAHTIAYDGSVMAEASAGSPTPLERFAAIGIPTLVMDGGASPDWIRTSARTLAETVPNARYRTLEGQDHGPADDVLVPALVEFFTAPVTPSGTDRPYG